MLEEESQSVLTHTLLSHRAASNSICSPWKKKASLALACNKLCNAEYVESLSHILSLSYIVSAPQPKQPTLIYQGQTFLRASHAFNMLDPDLETSC